MIPRSEIKDITTPSTARSMSFTFVLLLLAPPGPRAGAGRDAQQPRCILHTRGVCFVSQLKNPEFSNPQFRATSVSA